MKKLTILFTLTLTISTAGAQQYPETQLYMANPYLVNPGFTGYLTDISVYAGAMSPLTLNENAIRNYQVGINKSFERTYLGVGGKLTYDQRDFFESIYMDASFAYRVVIDNKQVLSIGSDVGLVNRTYNIGDLSPYVDLTDPTLSSDYYYKTNFKLGFGLAFYSTQLEAGIAAPYLIEGSEEFSGYFNAYLAYKLYFSNDNWIVKPNTYLVHYPDGSVQLQGNVMLDKSGVFWGQLGSSSSKSLSFATGWTFKSYELIYSHLHHLENELPYGHRSEVMLRILVGKSNRRLSHIASPRNRK